MTTPVVQPLESLRLARYAVPTPCYICGTDNTFDAQYCNHCSAPMALAHQANDPSLRPQMVATLGAAAVGKTVYLGMLMDMLCRQRSERVQVLARGAFSINLQEITLSALARCEFPEKTPNEPDYWNWVHCQVRRQGRRRPVELILPDMAGDALLEEINHPYTYRVVRSFLEKCSGALILIDAARIKDGTREQDYFTMKLVSYLSELGTNTAKDWSQQPVALVFTKADQCEECLEDPAAYAKVYAAGLWQHCQERFCRHKFFAASVTGACAQRRSPDGGRVLVPLRVEPRGIIEPFEWLLENLPTKKGR